MFINLLQTPITTLAATMNQFNSAAKQQPNWTLRILLGCLTVPVALFVFCGFGLWCWYEVTVGGAQRELAAETKYVRDRGAPLTTLELDRSYQPAKDREDITAALAALLAIANDPHAKEVGKNLPTVGNGADAPDPGTEWRQLAEVEAYLQLHRPLLNLLATLPNRKFTVRFPADFSLGPNMLLPDVQNVRHGALALQLQFQVDLHRDRPREAVKRILEIFALSQTLENEPIIVSQLVRTAVNSVALKNMQHLLKHADLTDGEILRLQTVLRQYKAQQAFGIALTGERASVYTINTWPQSTLSQPKTRAEVEQLEGRPPARTFDVAMTLQLFHKMEAANDESILQAIIKGREVDAEIKQLASSTRSKVLYMQTLLLMPALGVASEAFAGNEANFDAADAGLAAIRFRRQNGNWPATLSELVPKFLPTVPLDPFDGKPLRVVITNQEFKVYTISRDLIDQGGDFSLPRLPDRGFITTWREAK
jgi:hypothetical protein